MLSSGKWWVSGIALLVSACSSNAPRQPVIGTAWAGPPTLNLRKEIDAKSPVVTVVHHGDKLDIVGQRRRWYKVRTAKGFEGWTSDRELLDSAQMQRIRALAKETAGLPSQGAASTFSNLNVHMEPSRQSISFVQVREHEKVDVIAHRVATRVPPPRRELVPRKRKPVPQKSKPDKVLRPPVPPPPEPPPDWLALSPLNEPKPEEEDDGKLTPKDDWTLIRTEDGQSGWVLTSGLYLSIPDEVAQYAEGRRITSYFSLGKIQDGDFKKDIWLWTTADRLGEDHDFDGYRVFVWSLRRHRYETAYIQRRVRGFFPVLAKTGEFSVCLEQEDGSRIRKQYVMMGNAVRANGERPCEKAQEIETHPDEPETAPEETVEKRFTDRLKDKAKSLLAK